MFNIKTCPRCNVSIVGAVVCWTNGKKGTKEDLQRRVCRHVKAQDAAGRGRYIFVEEGSVLDYGEDGGVQTVQEDKHLTGGVVVEETDGSVTLQFPANNGGTAVIKVLSGTAEERLKPGCLFDALEIDPNAPIDEPPTFEELSQMARGASMFHKKLMADIEQTNRERPDEDDGLTLV